MTKYGIPSDLGLARVHSGLILQFYTKLGLLDEFPRWPKIRNKVFFELINSEL
jgi:hypothetical protein